MNKEEFIAQYAVERKHTNSAKWDGLEATFGRDDLLPLWVADTEFKIPKAAQDALIQRVHHGAFGYSLTPDEYYDAYFAWQKGRYQTEPQKDWMRFGLGVVSALSTIVRALTLPGESIMVLQPVYYPFMRVIQENDRHLVVSNLRAENDTYVMDMEDIANKMDQHHVKMLIFCSPHNPVGKVWSEQELTTLLELCREKQVLVVSDEIHHDLIVGDKSFVSALSIAQGIYRDNTVMVDSPSKTFNMAALLGSNIVIPNPQLRERYDKEVRELSLPSATVMAQTAATAAYRDGASWLEGLLAVIKDNYLYVKECLQAVDPQIKVADLQGTYLAWVDLSSVVAPEHLEYFIKHKAHLAVDFGDWFGEVGKGHIRLNLATTPAIVHQAMDQLAQAIVENKEVNQ